MSKDIASNRYALLVGIVLFSASISIGYSAGINRFSWPILIIYAYITLSFLGIVFFDLWRRAPKNRKDRLRFGKIWRLSGLAWHALGATITIAATIGLSQKTSAFNLEDPIEEHLFTYAATFALYAVTPIIIDSLVGLASRDIRKGRFLKSMMRAPCIYSASWFVVYFLFGCLLYQILGSLAYQALTSDNIVVPHIGWAVVIGSMMAAIKMLIFVKSHLPTSQRVTK